MLGDIQQSELSPNCLCTPASLGQNAPCLEDSHILRTLLQHCLPGIHTLALHSQRGAEMYGNSNQSSIPLNPEIVLLFPRRIHFIFFYLSQYDHGFQSCPNFMLILMLLKKYRIFFQKHYGRWLCVGIRLIWKWVIWNRFTIKKYLIHGGQASNQARKEL